MTIHRFSLQSQAAYSELVEALQVAETERSAEREGSLTRRIIKGRAYWYVRRRVGRRIQETYVGPETEELLERLEDLEQEVASAKVAARNRRGLIRMLRAAGYLTTDRRSGLILEELALAEVFRLQSVLVGTHAFRCYAAHLGARLSSELATTSDLDIAQERSVSVALTETASPPLHEALARAERFLRVPELDPRSPSTSWRTADQALRVDLLTPLVGRGREGPVELPALGAHASALRFLDYLLAETVPAAMLTGSGVLVRVPTPERFALHKLIVSQRRSAAEASKVTKDLAQAAALLEVLLEDRPADLADAWQDLVERGRKWGTEARRGGKRLPTELWDRFRALI